MSGRPEQRDSMTWHREDDEDREGDTAPSGQAANAKPGGLARSSGPGAGPDRQAERTVVRGAIVCVLIVLAAVIVMVVWPRIAFLGSDARPVVDTLYSSDLYVGPGAGQVDTRTVAAIVGTRPVATVVLAGDDPLADEPLHTCEAVVGQLPRLLVQVVVDGKFRSGCEGTKFPLAAGQDRDAWDFSFWLQQGYASSLVRDDIPELARQLALAYDAEVKGGRVVAMQRHFQAPPQRSLIAIGITAGVVVGAIALFLLLRLGTRMAFARVDRGREWERRRDGIDGELGDIAMTMVQVRPDDVADRALASALGDIAGDYAACLKQLSEASPGCDLGPLGDAVAAMQHTLEVART